MYIGRPTTTTKVQALISMFQYCRGMWLIPYHILAPLTEAYSGPKGRKILWNDTIEYYYKGINCMVYAENLLSYLYWKIDFTLHTYASDKHLSAVIN